MFETWTNKQRRLARELAVFVLSGVGVPKTDVLIPGTITLTVRRLCSDIERARLVEPFLMPLWRGI